MELFLLAGVVATIAVVVALLLNANSGTVPPLDITTGGTTLSPSSSQATNTQVLLWQDKLCTAHTAITEAPSALLSDNIFSILNIPSAQNVNTAAQNREHFILEAWRKENNKNMRSTACVRARHDDQEDLHACQARERALALAFNAVRDKNVRAWWARQSDAWEKKQKKGNVIDEEERNKAMSEAVSALCHMLKCTSDGYM